MYLLQVYYTYEFFKIYVLNIFEFRMVFMNDMKLNVNYILL